MSVTAPAPYRVTFYERDHPDKRQTALLGDTPATPATAGAGGTAGDWNVVTLPKRAAVTVWLGRANLILMTVPIVLGEATSGPVTPAYNALSHMWRPPDPTVRPPVVKVIGSGDAVPYQSLDYVISDIAWSDAIGDENGYRTMQKLTVTLLEFRDDEVLQQVKLAKPKHRGRSYTVRSGDTLPRIAERFEVKGGWRGLGDAQHPPIHDPRRLRVGQRLLIP